MRWHFCLRTSFLRLPSPTFARWEARWSKASSLLAKRIILACKKKLSLLAVAKKLSLLAKKIILACKNHSHCWNWNQVTLSPLMLTTTGRFRCEVMLCSDWWGWEGGRGGGIICGFSQLWTLVLSLRTSSKPGHRRSPHVCHRFQVWWSPRCCCASPGPPDCWRSRKVIMLKMLVVVN